jgi:hypothetical protein
MIFRAIRSAQSPSATTFSRKMVWAQATSSIRYPSAGEAVKREVDGVSGLGRLADLAPEHGYTRRHSGAEGFSLPRA